MDSREDLHLKSTAYAIRTNEASARVAGAKLAEFLKLRRDPEHRDRWQTSWGTKTDMGLASSVLAFMEQLHDQI